MLIDTIDIKGYIKFESVDIKRLEVELTSPIVTIIGTNGCGKSSFLEALTTYSQNKKMFKKNGAVKIATSHDGKDYSVGVDFSEKYPYFFSVDDTNLNDSGNTGTHNDLVEEHFGYSNELDKLLRMKYRVSNMGSKERKEMLMYFNPYDLMMVLDYQKKLSSALRAIKNNIKMLSQRKSVLEDKTVSVEEIERLRNDVAYLKKEYVNFDKSHLLCENKVKEVKNTLASFNVDSNKTLEYYNNKLNHISENMMRIWRNNKRTFSACKFIVLEQACQKISKLESELFGLADNIQDKISKLEQYKTYQQLDLEREVTPRKARIVVIEEELRKLDIENETVPVLSAEMNKFLLREFIPTIFSSVKLIAGTQVRIHSQKIINKVKNKLNDLLYIVNNVAADIIRCEQEYYTISKNLNETLNKSYPPSCEISSCFLKNNLDTRANVLKDQLTQLEKYIAVKTTKKVKYSNVVSILTKITDESELYKNEMEIFKTVHMEHGWLLKFMCSGSSLLALLNSSPNKLMVNLQRLTKLLGDRIVHSELEMEKKTILFELIKLEDPNIPVKEIINDMVKQLDVDIKSMQTRYEKINSSLATLATYTHVNKEYANYYHQLKEMKEEYDIWLEHSVLKQRLSFFTLFTDWLASEKDRIKNSLMQNEIVMKEQDNIHLILYTEIIPTLTDLIKKEADYAILEKAMNPSDGLPRKYLLGYLNNIINNTNFILAQTWSYELQIVPLKEDEDIDFTFKRIVNGEVADDISMCSSSQMDIIDIAWNLAMIISLGYGKEYPIYFDEIDKHFDEGHREKLITLINTQIKNDNIRQIFLVNHHAALSSGLMGSQTICLSTNNISVPENYNDGVTIHYK